MILNYTQVKLIAYNAGFKGIYLEPAVRIAYCESSFNTDAHNTSREDSRGLFQINVNAHPQYSNYNLFDPDVNASVAYQVFLQSGKDFSDWTCANQLGLVNPAKIYFGIGLALLGITLLYSS